MIDPLHSPMDNNDAMASTVKEYFKSLLVALITEKEGFSGKRPFGNSGWENDLYKALIKSGAVDGKIDSDGYIDHVDIDEADKLLVALVHRL